MNEFKSLIDLLFMLAIDSRTGVLFILLIVAAVIDYQTYKMPNRLTLGGTACALIYNTAFTFLSHGGCLWARDGRLLGRLIMLPTYALNDRRAG